MLNSRIKINFTFSLLLWYLISFSNAKVERIEYDISGQLKKLIPMLPKKNFF